MVFFRSEERAREWCEANGEPLRPIVTMEQLWHLAIFWYSTRLQPGSARPTSHVAREFFGAIGLVGDFWNPEADKFGRG